MPRVVPISRENNAFQYVETLRRKREKRQRHREFFIEGVRPINAALAYGWEIRAFLYAHGRPLSDWARDILARSQAPTHYELLPALLERLSGKSEPSELLAIVAMPDDTLTRLPHRPVPRLVVFDRPASPGNLGTLIRSCDALAVDGLIVSGHAVDLYDPETISASTGSLFALPAVRVGGPGDLLPWLDSLRDRVQGLQVVGSDERGSVDLDAHDLARPTVLVLGNETWGMSAAYRDLCDTVVRIPIVGSASSLNVACAASIILYEMERQRRARQP